MDTGAVGTGGALRVSVAGGGVAGWLDAVRSSEPLPNAWMEFSETQDVIG